VHSTATLIDTPENISGATHASEPCLCENGGSQLDSSQLRTGSTLLSASRNFRRHPSGLPLNWML